MIINGKYSSWKYWLWVRRMAFALNKESWYAIKQQINRSIIFNTVYQDKNTGWTFWSYKSLSVLPESGPYRIFVLVFNWNHFEMRLLNLRINFYLLRTFLIHLGSLFVFVFFLCCFFFHYFSAKFHLWPSSGDLPRPWIGMLSLVTISPVITAFQPSCNRIPSNYCLDHSSRPVAQRIGRWVSTVPGEHCQKIAVSNPTQAGQRFTWSKTWCDR